MSSIVLIAILKYLKINNLKTLKEIKNKILFQFTNYLICRRFIMSNYMSLEEIKSDIAKYGNFYFETIDTNYLATKECEQLLSILKRTDFNEKFIYLKKCKVGDLGVQFLSFCHFKYLEELSLENTDITDKAMEYLVKMELIELKSLFLSKTKISDKGIECLINCYFHKLETLHLYKTQITDRVIEILGKCNFKNLSEIGLSINKLTDFALELMSKYDFRNLEYISLYETLITDKAIELLINCDFKNLKSLSLQRTNVSINSILTIFNKYPNCIIWYSKIICNGRKSNQYSVLSIKLLDTEEVKVQIELENALINRSKDK